MMKRMRLFLVAAVALFVLAGAAALKRVPGDSEVVRVARDGGLVVLRSGWHFVGPGATLVRYPTGPRSYRVPSSGTLPVVFSNGDSLDVAFDFDLVIPAGTSESIYRRFSSEFESAFARLVTAAAQIEAAAAPSKDALALDSAVVARVQEELLPLGVTDVTGQFAR
jgi:hypothetical protein